MVDVSTGAAKNIDMAGIKGDFRIDPERSRLGFIARHLMSTKVRGCFTEFEGSASGDGADIAGARVHVTIKAASVNTKNEMRDEHLRSKDFFETEKFPKVTFVSSSLRILEEEPRDTLEISGELTMHGVSNQLTIPFTIADIEIDEAGVQRIVFQGESEISRKDYGLTWNKLVEAGGMAVGDTITLDLTVCVVRES